LDTLHVSGCLHRLVHWHSIIFFNQEIDDLLSLFGVRI
jgi:hypothetical protein